MSGASWTGTIRLSDADAETLVWLSRKLDPKALRGLPFVDVIRHALRSARAEIEATERHVNKKALS